MDKKTEILNKIRAIYDHNVFTHDCCGIEIRDISYGSAKLGIIVDKKKHINLNNSIHGGMTFTLMDNATGVAGATMGKRVVTVSTTATYLHTANPGDNIEAECNVLSVDGDKVNMEMFCRNLTTGELVGKATSCMLIIGTFPDIPEKW
ncbi:MAG: PaaI family thioesterase [Acidaminococcaceae bacterium]|nr:PaaI family thioesterase [Acidaminococcaceae bacterium]